jgi:Ca2+/Na+ antiporter
MPDLQTIIKKYQLPPNLAGFLIAVGCSVPEFSTNMISSFSSKPEMVGFGFGAIIGSGVFDFTLCFGIASCFSYYVHKKGILFDLNALLRDIIIYLATMLFIIYVFWDYKITISDSLILTAMNIAYFKYLSASSPAENTVQGQGKQALTNEDQPYWSESYNIFFRNLPSKYHNQPAASAPSDSKYHEEMMNGIIDDEEGMSMLEEEDADKNGMRPNHFKQDFYFSHPYYRIAMTYFDKIQGPWLRLYNYTIPYRKYPLIGFLVSMLYIFIITRYNVFTVDCVVGRFHVSHAFLGLTFVSWGGNISDIINCSIAAKNKQTELATSSIIGSQIFNLHICLGCPWLLANLIFGEIPIVDSTIFISIIVVFVVVLVSLGLILLFKLKLNYPLGILLIISYFVYMWFEYVQTSQIMEGEPVE